MCVVYVKPFQRLDDLGAYFAEASASEEKIQYIESRQRDAFISMCGKSESDAAPHFQQAFHASILNREAYLLLFLFQHHA